MPTVPKWEYCQAYVVMETNEILIAVNYALRPGDPEYVRVKVRGALSNSDSTAIAFEALNDVVGQLGTIGREAFGVADDGFRWFFKRPRT